MDPARESRASAGPAPGPPSEKPMLIITLL